MEWKVCGLSSSQGWWQVVSREARTEKVMVMGAIDSVVRGAISISRELAYAFIVHKGKVRTLFVRPFGLRGQGIWLRRVLPGPSISPPYVASATEYEEADDE